MIPIQSRKDKNDFVGWELQVEANPTLMFSSISPFFFLSLTLIIHTTQALGFSQSSEIALFRGHMWYTDGAPLLSTKSYNNYFRIKQFIN